MHIAIAMAIVLVVQLGCSSSEMQVQTGEDNDSATSDVDIDPSASTNSTNGSNQARDDAGADGTLRNDTGEMTDVAHNNDTALLQDAETNGDGDQGNDIGHTDDVDQSIDAEQSSDTGQPNGDQPGDEELPCDDGFAFSPDPPQTGVINTVTYMHIEGLVYIGMIITGTGEVILGDVDISGDSPYYWTWEYTVSQSGKYDFIFTHDDNVPKANCERMVHDTGPAPDWDSSSESPPDGDCTCGQGADCSSCPVQGSCFDSPSDYHPDPNQSGWQCNDVAECTDGSCRIWCPFEPCPEGQSCPNNTEACWVDPTIDDYETACQQCCESYGAQWNGSGKYCAIP